MDSLFNAVTGIFQGLPDQLNYDTGMIGQVLSLGHAAYEALKKKHILILKALLTIFTITCAAASLKYAIDSARLAHYQLLLSEREFCEAHPQYREEGRCQDILAGDLPIRTGGCSGFETHVERIFSIFGPYKQEYSQCYEHVFGTAPWWHSRRGLYKMGLLRPIFWRFPDVYFIAFYLRGLVGYFWFLIGSIRFLFQKKRSNGRRITLGMLYFFIFVLPQMLSWLLLRAEHKSEKAPFKVTYEVTANSLKKSISSDYLILAIPYTVQRTIAKSKPFIPMQEMAVRDVRYVEVTKILLQYKKRWWEEVFTKHGQGLNGGLPSDLPIRYTMFPKTKDNTQFKHSNRGVIMAAYTFEQDATILGSLSPDRRIQIAAENLNRIFPGAKSLDLLEAWASQVFPADELAGGSAFCYFRPMQKTKFLDTMQKPDWENRVFFAGEQASFTHGWIQGAFEAGLDVFSKSGLLLLRTQAWEEPAQFLQNKADC
ncbi:amino-acid oxidase [Fusarium tjaetaba]|uniref:Amino-acid oxidase n=1 Tax=Fusarium tjaetaba TaxID=1567544 RepID=A0A8H5VSC8_9HYPO|nr:amino-acid oxidase [Fusarium tjaetaba]KAF5633826.1 amino-acid oxidase [Fusarium tjaetaba]